MRYTLLFLALFGLLAPDAKAEDIEVDVELALMVDVSRSMEPWELELQRRGYAEALVSDQVIGVIQNGFIGKIAVTYVEWAGNGSQRIVVVTLLQLLRLLLLLTRQLLKLKLLNRGLTVLFSKLIQSIV